MSPRKKQSDDMRSAEVYGDLKPGGASSQRFRKLSGFALFFGLYYVLIWQLVCPHLIYHSERVAGSLRDDQFAFFPMFATGAEFFLRFLDHPGGPVEYVSAYLSQYFYFCALGALVITMAVGVICLATSKLVRCLCGRSACGLQYLPAVLLLVPIVRYSFWLQEYVAVALALVASVAYMCLAARARGTVSRSVVFSVMSVVLYYAASGPYMLFAALCGIFELVANRRYAMGSILLAAGVILPLAGAYAFDISVGTCLTSQLGILPAEFLARTIAFSALYLLLVILSIACALHGAKTQADAQAPPGRWMLRWGRYNPPIMMVILLIVAFAALNRDARANLRVNYFARTQQWDRVLAEAERGPRERFSMLTVQDINRALYETGRLGDELFAYPQNPRMLVAFGVTTSLHPAYRELLFSLGAVNTAEHAAYEVLEYSGARPHTLRLLAKIYLVKNQPQTARVFLNALKKDVIHRQWAQEYLARIDEDPTMSSDEELNRIRSLMPTENMISSGEPEATLVELLKRNRRNKMAYEYLMAFYLYTGQTMRVASTVRRMKEDFGYDRIPRHFAEAILIANWGRSVPLFGLEIDPEIRKSYEEVNMIIKSNRGNQKKAAEEVSMRFPNSYYRYVMMGLAGEAQ